MSQALPFGGYIRANGTRTYRVPPLSEPPFTIESMRDGRSRVVNRRGRVAIATVHHAVALRVMKGLNDEVARGIPWAVRLATKEPEATT